MTKVYIIDWKLKGNSVVAAAIADEPFSITFDDFHPIIYFKGEKKFDIPEEVIGHVIEVTKCKRTLSSSMLHKYKFLRLVLDNLESYSSILESKDKRFYGPSEPFVTYLSEKNLPIVGWFEVDLNNPSLENIVHIKDSTIPAPHVLSFDIECAHKEDIFPKCYRDYDRVVCIGIEIVKRDVKQRICFTHVPESENNTFIKDDIKFVNYGDEVEMIQDFFALIIDSKVNVVTGFNATGFDISYLEGRLAYYAVKPKYLKIMHTASKTEFLTPRDASFFEYDNGIVLDVYDRVKGEKAEEHSLNYTANFYLSEGKKKIDYSEISGTMATYMYCMKDVDLTTRLFFKLGIYRNAIALSEVSHYYPKWQYLKGLSVRCMNLYNSYCIGMNIIPDYNKDTPLKVNYQGAHCEALTGLFHNAVLLDFKSHYPNSCIQNNICTYVKLTRDDIKTYKITDYREIVAEGNTYYYAKNTPGIFPTIMDSLIKARSAIKPGESEEGDARALAFKLYSNSLYGVSGTPDSKYLYDVDVAKCITSVGRSTILEARDFCQFNGYIVCYIDTDSLGLSLGSLSVEIPNGMEEGKRLGNVVSEHLKEKGFGNVKLDCKGFYRTFVVLSNKKYIMCDVNKFTVSGKTVQKRGYSKFSRYIYDRCLNMIISGSSESSIKEFLVEHFYKLISGKIPVKKLVFIQRITRTLMKNKDFMDRMESLGEDLEADSTIKAVYVHTDGTTAATKSLVTYRTFKKHKMNIYYSPYIRKTFNSIIVVLEVIGFTNVLDSLKPLIKEALKDKI